MAASKVFFTQFEKQLVLVLVKPHLHIVDNKETNAVVCQRKKEVFDKITRQFNATEGVEHRRTSQQIRQCYLNLKKKIKKNSSDSRQERRTIGGAEILTKEASDVEMRFLKEPILKMPKSIAFDSDVNTTEISKSQENFTTTAPLIHPIILSQSVSENISDMDASFDPSNIESNKEKIIKVKTPRPSSESTAKSSTHSKESHRIIRKYSKTPSPPSAAARATACIETEHRTTMQYMEKEERRKAQQAKVERAEHELRMELLREKIKLTRTKTKLHEKLLAGLEDPSDNVSFEKYINLLE